ncbi:MAG: tRNA threonylcarbamoyladenosine dehydratase [Bacteroidales bacterium]|nr:tRNA threonylcarbamoyladenosine dehydratase [Bacteroidales bacterium]MCF8404154.1 tRNA threonylcarbamoyladenosine dehydratase [Bacteroidales bacterium]
MDENNWLARTELLLGKTKVQKLKKAHVLIAGLGGVGGFAAEALCRAGVGELTIVDSDKVSPTNRNRQIIATQSAEGLDKIELMANRLMDINPELKLHPLKVYLKDEKIPALLDTQFDYVVDAIDTLSPKIFFIKNCIERNLKLVSSMGSGGRLDPSQIKVADMAGSYGCQFAQVVRKKLHGWGIRTGFKVVFSPEKVPKHAVIVTDSEANKKSTVGTISYMPAIFGLYIASVVIRDLIEEKE